jgi:hypothetical protein
VKERILPLTTLPSQVGGLTRALRGSTSEEDFLARAEAWASKLEAAARTDVEGADLFLYKLNARIRDEIGRERRFPIRDLMRELLDTGAPVRLPSARFNLSSAMFASIIRTS